MIKNHGSGNLLRRLRLGRKEGYPYHFFHEADLELATEARKLSIEQASAIFLTIYLKGSVFCPVKKKISMFRAFLYGSEIENALKTLYNEKVIILTGSGRDALVCSGAAQ
jgi:hypothetical protein